MVAILLIIIKTNRGCLNSVVGEPKTDTVALLQQLNFTEDEARAYLALLGRNPLNGYECGSGGAARSRGDDSVPE